MSEIFVSYKKEDAARVEPIVRALAAAGYEVWWDHRIPPGRSYRDVIGAALANAKCVIVVWSHLAANAQWVLDEADEGKRRNVLLPILIDDVEIPYGFRQIEAARLIGWSGDTAHPEWAAALDTVGHFVGRAPGGPPKPLQANLAGAPPQAEAPKPAPAPEAPPARRGAGPLIALAAIAGLVLIGGFAAMQFGLIGGSAQTTIAESPAPEPPLAPASGEPGFVRVSAPETGGFRRLADGAWVEYAPGGMARFRFTEESREGELFRVRDATRNIVLEIDGRDKKIYLGAGDGRQGLYEITAIEPAAPPPAHDAAMPAEGATRIWFESGGMLARDAAGAWIETDPASGMPNGFVWTEESRDADTISAKDDSRGARVRIELAEGVIYLFFPDWGEFRPQWKIRAVDYEG